MEVKDTEIIQPFNNNYEKLNLTFNSFHCNMKSGEFNFIPLDMRVYLIYPYSVTLEMHLFSKCQ